MRLDSGILTIRRLVNVAEPGLMPLWKECTILKCCYGERTVGASRYYNAQQADMQIDMVVRIQRTYEAKTGDRIRLKPYSHTPPDLPFLVLQVQQVEDEERLPATDLTLRVMTENEIEEDEE